MVATASTTSTAASVHVAFSTTSVVLRTPMIWFDAAKFEAKPPPFDSWMSTMNVSRTATMTAKITSTVYICLLFIVIFVYYQFLQETNLVCKVTTFFWIIQVYFAHYFKGLLVALLFDVDFG